MNIVTINGMRLLITGGSARRRLAMKPQTGEPYGTLVVAKRGMNTGMVAHGKYAIVSHGDENLEGNRNGHAGRVRRHRKDAATSDSIKWMVKGYHGRLLVARHRWRPPLPDRQWRQSARLRRRDGRQLWKQTLGTIQKASAVFADGKIYVGTESGKFFILRPHADHCEVLSDVELPLSDQGLASQRIPEPIVAAARRSRAAACTSSPATRSTPSVPSEDHGGFVEARTDDGAGAGSAPAWVQVTPPKWC